NLFPSSRSRFRPTTNRAALVEWASSVFRIDLLRSEADWYTAFCQLKSSIVIAISCVFVRAIDLARPHDIALIVTSLEKVLRFMNVLAGAGGVLWSATACRRFGQRNLPVKSLKGCVISKGLCNKGTAGRRTPKTPVAIESPHYWNNTIR